MSIPYADILKNMTEWVVNIVEHWETILDKLLIKQLRLDFVDEYRLNMVLAANLEYNALFSSKITVGDKGCSSKGINKEDTSGTKKKKQGGWKLVEIGSFLKSDERKWNKLQRIGDAYIHNKFKDLTMKNLCMIQNIHPLNL